MGERDDAGCDRGGGAAGRAAGGATRIERVAGEGAGHRLARERQAEFGNGGEAEGNEAGGLEAVAEFGIGFGRDRGERGRTADDGQAGDGGAEILHQEGNAGEGLDPVIVRPPGEAGVDRLGRPVAALLLGPLAVDSAREGQGIGAALMRAAIAEAKQRGHGAILLVGDPEYYERFGFFADKARHLVMPGPFERRRFLGLELTEGWLDDAAGVIVASGARA